MDNPIKASEHTDITENNNSWTKLLKFIKENGAIFTIVTTLITVVATHAFKLCVYWFHKGRYDFFNIPSEFIEINYEASLWGFLQALAI